MTDPQPVPESALRRLRRSYAVLLLLLSVPIAAAIAYVLVLQYQLVLFGTQRQMAMSTDRRVTRLDGLLGPLRADVLRLRDAAREPTLVRDAVADRGSLTHVPGGWTLDALPSLLQSHAPQVVLTGSGWADAAARDAAVVRASAFGEQARLLISQGTAVHRVYHVDPVGGELWVYPWTGSADLLAEHRAASLPDLVTALGTRARERRGTSMLDDEVHWQFVAGEGGQRTVELTALVPVAEQERFVVAEVPASALEPVRIEAGIGRFWVVDRSGAVILDHLARDHPVGGVLAGGLPNLDRQAIDEALHSPVAVNTGALLLTARESSVAPWLALYAGDGQAVRRRVLADIGPYIGAGVGLLLLFVGVAVLLWQRFGLPSLRLVDYLHRNARDAGAEPPDVPAAWQPWVRLTRETFAAWRGAAAREQRSEALKSSIVDHALAAVIATDEHGGIVEFNPAAEVMFGHLRDQVLWRSFDEVVVPPRLRSGPDGFMRQVAAAEASPRLGERFETIAQRADGSEFPVEMVVWRAGVGASSYYTASLFDLTDRRRAAAELERQREALRQSEKLTAMGSLLAGVAHELNNPLSIVMGRASLLEAKTDDVELRDDIVRIREAAERCGRIVRAFLGMARKSSVAPGPVQLNDMVRGAADLLQYNLRTGGIAIELRLADDLPTVHADADRLGQVVLNLIVNAQQALATVASPRRLLLETGLEATRPSRAPRVWLRVADNGPGVEPALQSRIFDPFFTTKPEGAGTGLGLAVSRTVAREHGGNLALEPASPFGRGASLRLSLPVAPEAVVEPTLSPIVAYDSEPAAARVLVVDDETELADLMREMLEGGGYEVASAESGAVALELLAEARFDAIVCDLRMPDMDGPALWHAVSERFPALAARTVFVTGDTLSPAARGFLADTRRPCVEKPFTPRDLLQAVQAALSSGGTGDVGAKRS